MQIQEQIATSATSDTFKGLWNGYAVAVKSLKDQENLDPDQVKAIKAEIQTIR